MTKKKCKTKHCRNTTKGSFCTTCHVRNHRKKDPIRYAYQTLKDNSKRRGKEFTLTLEEFKTFCVHTDYITGKGKSKESYSIDRVDNTKGYTIDNIRVITLSENSKKKTKILEYDYESGYAEVRQSIIGRNDEGPF